jgi:hypothetical protein
MPKALRWICTAELADIAPRVWRDVEVDADVSLHDLNLALQSAFGWDIPTDNYEFHINGTSFKERDLYAGTEPVTPKPIALRSLLKGLIGERFQYVRTCDATWVFHIELSGVKKGDASVPQCIEGEGAMPCDEFGGNEAYGEFLTGQRGPSSSVRDFYAKWADEVRASGGWFNDVDLVGANERLRNLSEYEW